MATRIKKKNIKSVKKSFASPFNIYWDKTNYILLGAGIAVLIIGYYLMGQGSWNSTSSLVLSPILLFIGYVIIFPAAILFRKKNNTEQTSDEKAE